MTRQTLSRSSRGMKRAATTSGHKTITHSKRAKPSTAGPPRPKKEASQQAESIGAAQKLSDTKWTAWSRHADSPPFPSFARPTREECYTAHSILEELHGDTVRQNFGKTDMNYPIVMDALVVAAISQATSWANAQRAMRSMSDVYGSTFAYDAIVAGGADKLRDALRPGGMQNRKAKILMGLLHDVKARHGRWDLQYLFDKTDEDVVKEVVSYWGIGLKCAHCLLSICLHRNRFAVDTHIYRISGLWGWRPNDAGVGDAQAHLNIRVPDDIKFELHYQLIVHGRECPVCRGNGSGKLVNCEFWTRFSSLVDIR